MQNNKTSPTLDDFEKWLREIGNAAVAEKRTRAEKAGDVEQWKRQIWRAPDKNLAIKQKFREEGNKLERGYRSRPAFDPIMVDGKPGLKTVAREWLYDFVWRKFDDQDNLCEVVLAMEIEFSDVTESKTRRDFNKLLQADSTYKIFVFQKKTEQDVKAEIETLKGAAGRYRYRFDSSFLLCGWSTRENAFLFDRFEARVAAA